MMSCVHSCARQFVSHSVHSASNSDDASYAFLNLCLFLHCRVCFAGQLFDQNFFIMGWYPCWLFGIVFHLALGLSLILSFLIVRLVVQYSIFILRRPPHVNLMLKTYALCTTPAILSSVGGALLGCDTYDEEKQGCAWKPWCVIVYGALNACYAIIVAVLIVKLKHTRDIFNMRGSIGKALGPLGVVSFAYGLANIVDRDSTGEVFMKVS